MKNPINSSVLLNFLVIEDNPADFFLIEEYIAEMFLHTKVTNAVDFSQAQEYLTIKGSEYDSILLDITLPDSQGLKLVSDILFLADQIPVVILTGYESLEFSINSLSIGVSEYLLKDEITAYSLYKSILFSIERKKYYKRIEESEKKYSELFHLSPLPMWLYDLTNLQIINVNPAAINQYGFSKEEFINMSVLDLIPGKKDKKKIENQNEGSLDINNLSHKLKDGTIIQVQIEQNYLTIDGHRCCIMLSNNITELLDTQDSLRIAYRNIIKIEENEREKFAGEIHDGLQQNIVAAKLIFAFLTEQFPDLAEEPRAQLMAQSLQSALDECSALIQSARPKNIIEKNGFYSEIESIIEKVKATGDIDVIHSNNVDMDRLFGYFDLMHIYRMIQELFNNSLKHATASQIILNVNIQDDEVQIFFKDNGIGLTKDVLNAKSSFLSLKRRVRVLGASMNIDSTINQGIVINISIPLKTKSNRGRSILLD